MCLCAVLGRDSSFRDFRSRLDARSLCSKDFQKGFSLIGGVFAIARLVGNSKSFSAYLVPTRVYLILSVIQKEAWYLPHLNLLHSLLFSSFYPFFLVFMRNCYSKHHLLCSCSCVIAFHSGTDSRSVSATRTSSARTGGCQNRVFFSAPRFS